MRNAFLREYRTVLRQTPFQLIVIVNEDEPGGQAPGTGTKAGAAGGIGQAVRHEERRKAEHDDDADELFHNLGNRRRCHVLPALQVAAIAGDDGREENGRCQGDERIVGPAFTDNVIIDEQARAEKDEDTQNQCRRTEHRQGNAENPLGPAIIQAGYFFRRNN